MKLRYRHSDQWPTSSAYDVDCWQIEDQLGIHVGPGMGSTVQEAKADYLNKLVTLRDGLTKAIEKLSRQKPAHEKMVK